jgi:hypothetical protein
MQVVPDRGDKRKLIPVFAWLPMLREATFANHPVVWGAKCPGLRISEVEARDVYFHHGLHARQHDAEVQLYAFDCLALDGDDLRKLPLSLRKTNLARLLARRPDGIFVAPFEQGEIGPDLFRKACEFGLEGLVSKHRDRAYRTGTSPNWVKVKNPKHPAMTRVMKTLQSLIDQ